MYKIKLHSIVDVITNSSTVIYTYQDKCVEPFKEMIDAIAKTFGIDKTCDDMFDVFVSCDSFDYAIDRLEDLDDDNLNEDLVIIKNMDDWYQQEEALKEYIKNGGDTSDIIYEDDQTDTSINIVPKDEKYKFIAEASIKFLNSPYTEEGYD